MGNSTHAPVGPHVPEIVEMLVACGVGDAANLVLSAYICGQPPHVAEVASRMLAALLDEGHDPDALLEHAAWIPVFCSLLPDSFATAVARATCVQYVFLRYGRRRQLPTKGPALVAAHSSEANDSLCG